MNDRDALWQCECGWMNVGKDVACQRCEMPQAMRGQGMNELTEFLLARIAEDEAEARCASPGPWLVDPNDAESVLAIDKVEVLSAFALSGPQTRATAAHIARHDPARILAECAAKRAVAGLHTVGADQCDEHNAMFESIPCPTVRALAAVYKDHPDYQQEWS